MRAATIALGVLVLAVVCLGYQAAAQVAQPHCCTAIQAPPTSTPTPPPGIPSTAPFQVYMGETGAPCSGGGNGKDPGAAADAALGKSSGFIAETCALSDLTGTTLRNNCPGWNENTYVGTGVGCLALWYEDLYRSPCATNGEKALYTYATGTNELAFLHTYGTSGNPRTAGFRYTDGSGSCNGTTIYRMNPGDPATATWLGANVFGNLTYYPTPNPAPPQRANRSFGVMEDNVEIGDTAWVHSSTEFGGTTATTGFSWLVGTSPNNAGYTALAQIAAFVNATGVPTEANMMGGMAHPCVTKVGTHCFGSSSFAQGLYDTQYRTDLMCAALTNNDLKTIMSERTVVASGEAYNALNLITSMINTMANFVNDNATNHCANVRFVDLDEAIFPPSTLANDARWEELALYAMVPSNTGANDEMWPFWYTAGRTSTELSIWPDREIVAYGPEEKPADFVWGQTVEGGTANPGTGCPKNGDTGGAVALLVYYNSSTGACIFAQQYKHCLVETADQGPCEYILNPTSATVTITDGTGGTANFCPGDPCATYTWSAGFTGFELSSLNGINLSAGCSNATYCNGALVWNNATFTPGTTTIGPNSGILLHGGTVPPPPGNTYVYTGCAKPVQIYNGNAGTGDAIFNKDISGVAPDPSSANLIAKWGSTSFSSQNDNSSLERVNCATNTTPRYLAVTNSSHNPPIQFNAGANLGGSGATVPWCLAAGTGCVRAFVFEGQYVNGGCPGDCHWVTLNTDTGVDIEGGGGSANSCCSGGQISLYQGEELNLNLSFTTNWVPNGNAYSNATGDSGIPKLGCVVWGDDLSATTINHPLCITLPTSMSMCYHGVPSGCTESAPAYGTNISPGVGADGVCITHSANCFLYGDLFRLKATVSCGSNTQAIKVCNAWKKYGAYLIDTGGSPQVSLGQSANGSDPITSGLITWIQGLHISDMDIVTRGTTRP